MKKYAIMIMSHNNHEMLGQCIGNIKAHTPFDYDLVVVDDASNPPYKIDDATVVRMPRRSNCCNLRNVGMEMARGEYVFWLDNDTMVGEGWYQPLCDVIEDDPSVGLTGQPKDARIVRKPFLPLTQSECMVEYQFAYDYNHVDRQCDYITSYCVLVKREAYRPAYCYRMPTPLLDPELGAGVKSNGYTVKVAEKNMNINHIGSATERPGGLWYHYWLSRMFTKWFRFWEPQADKVFECYMDKEVIYEHNANEPTRSASIDAHGDRDKDYADDALPDAATMPDWV